MTLPRAVLLLAAAALVAGCAGPRRSRVSDARRVLARELLERGDPRAALPYASALCRERPGDADALALRGIIHGELGLVDESERDLREALALDGKIAQAHSALGALYDRQRRHEEANRHHARAVELDGDDPRVLNNLGFSRFTQGKAREAIPVYLRALRAAPADERIRNNLGFAYAVAGDFPRAAQNFALGGSAAEAMNNLGWAYEQKGLPNQAYDLYVEAVRLDPALAAARSNMIAVAEALGRPIPADLREPALPAGGEAGR